MEKLASVLLLPTVPLPPPVSLQFPLVTHSVMRVSWVPADQHVPGHRITYTTNHGSDVNQVKLQTPPSFSERAHTCILLAHLILGVDVSLAAG